MDTKALRQKILDLAIRGKLVPQDPNDEPASVLLERIRAEKERLIAEGKIKPSKTSKSSGLPHYQKELPKGWAWTTIDEICEVERGGNFAKKDFVQNGFPCIHYGQIHTKFGDSISEVISFIEPSLAKKQKIAHKNDIVMAVTSENMQDVCKCTAWIGDYDVAIGGHTAIIRHTIDPLFLVYYFRSQTFCEQKEKYAHGSKVIEMSPLTMTSFLLPLPPLSEQLRIVSKIEMLFSLIDVIEADKSDVIGLIKQAKSKILSLAIQGKLVEQDPVDEAAETLLRRINPKWHPADTSQYPFLIPKEWCFARLEDLCSFISRGKSPKYSEEHRYPVFAQKCNLYSGGISLKYAKFLDPSTLNKWPEVYKLITGDILINSTGTGTVGRTRLFNESVLNNYPFVVPDSHVSVVRSYKEIDSQYLYSTIESHYYQEYINNNLAGSTNQKELYIGVLKNMLIPLPPINEQKRIVKKIEELFGTLDEIQRQLTN